MSDVTPVPLAADQPAAQASLAERLTRLRRRAGYQVTDRTLLTVGSILLPLGLVLVVLGWYGAAHTTRLFEEIPYLISGGLLGIGLVIVGGFCYFGYFLARILATSRELLDTMLRIEERLDGELRVEMTRGEVTREGSPAAAARGPRRGASSRG
jgi:hypothetical protein